MRSRLSVEERAMVWRMVREGSGWSVIARELDRHPSVINSYAHACGVAVSTQLGPRMTA